MWPSLDVSVECVLCVSINQECLAVTIAANIRVTRDTKEDLLKQSGALLTTARSAIEKLKAEGKHELAAGIETVEKFLMDIENQVHNFHPHTLLGQGAQHILEQLLKRGETMLEDALKKVQQPAF